MFCPNCGKEYSGVMRCPVCGQNANEDPATKSFEEKRKELRESGERYCPYCLSTDVVVNDRPPAPSGYLFSNTGGKLIGFLGVLMRDAEKREYGKVCICRTCGYGWREYRVHLMEKHRDYIARILKDDTSVAFPGINGSYLTVDYGKVVISLTEKKGCIIPLEDIDAVDYQLCLDSMPGRLSIRDRSHKKRRFPKNIAEAEKDRFTILFDSSYKGAYYRLYSALGLIAEENRAAETNNKYLKYLETILGGYSYYRCVGLDGAYIEINRGDIRIVHAKQGEYRMKYRDLAAVEFAEMLGPIPGRLTVLDREHAHCSVPSSLEEAREDPFTVHYHPNGTKDFRELYSVLSKIAEENKKV